MTINEFKQAVQNDTELLSKLRASCSAKGGLNELMQQQGNIGKKVSITR